MPEEKSLNHSVWACKYHIVWIPKCRRKQLYGQIARYLGGIFHDLARQKQSRIVEGQTVPGSYPYAYRDTAKVCDSPRGGLHQGEECNSDSPKVPAAEKLYRTKLLGARILCINGWTRRRGNKAIHPGAEEKRIEQLELFSDK